MKVISFFAILLSSFVYANVASAVPSEMTTPNMPMQDMQENNMMNYDMQAQKIPNQEMQDPSMLVAPQMIIDVQEAQSREQSRVDYMVTSAAEEDMGMMRYLNFPNILLAMIMALTCVLMMRYQRGKRKEEMSFVSLKSNKNE